MGAKFINIELEIKASFDLVRLVDSFGDQFVVSSCDKNKELDLFVLSGAVVPSKWNYEVNNSPDADTIALCLCGIVNGLDSVERDLWNRASTKVFDVGLEFVPNGEIGVSIFRADTLSEISKIGAGIVISVYDSDKDVKA